MIRLLLHGCVQELYSLLFRIRFQYRSASLLGGVGVGPLVEPDCNGVLRPCRRSLACIRDMQSFVAAYPWATDFDRTLFRDVWLEGARYSARSADYGTEDSTLPPLQELTGSFAPSAEKVRPWQVDPYKLLSWWDMQRFSAQGFFILGNVLGFLPENIRKAAHPELYELDGNEKVSEKTRRHVDVWVKEVQKRCEDIGLDSAVDHAKRVRWYLEREQTYSDISHHIEELKNRVLDDMKRELFLYVRRPEAKYYQPIDGFGEEVAYAFPSIGFDVREAHTCYALGRSTACVFHLMRILEVALVAFGTIFGLKFSHTNWGPAIDQIESKVRGMGSDPAWNTKLDWKDRQEFYSQAVDYLRITKDAWRNYTAHARGVFDQDDAKRMLENVKMFMQHITPAVSDRSSTISP
jgi:hypothetical protein